MDASHARRCTRATEVDATGARGPSTKVSAATARPAPASQADHSAGASGSTARASQASKGARSSGSSRIQPVHRAEGCAVARCTSSARRVRVTSSGNPQRRASARRHAVSRSSCAAPAGNPARPSSVSSASHRGRRRWSSGWIQLTPKRRRSRDSEETGFTAPRASRATRSAGRRVASKSTRATMGVSRGATSARRSSSSHDTGTTRNVAGAPSISGWTTEAVPRP